MLKTNLADWTTDRVACLAFDAVLGGTHIWSAFHDRIFYTRRMYYVPHARLEADLWPRRDRAGFFRARTPGRSPNAQCFRTVVPWFRRSRPSPSSRAKCKTNQRKREGTSIGTWNCAASTVIRMLAVPQGSTEKTQGVKLCFSGIHQKQRSTSERTRSFLFE